MTSLLNTLLALTFVLGSTARAQSSEAAGVRESLAYLRDHAELFIDEAPATAIKKLATGSALIGAGTVFAAVALNMVSSTMVLRSELSINTISHLVERVSPSMAAIGAMAVTGAVAVHLAAIYPSSLEQKADRAELRRQHRALLALLRLPPDEAYARVSADPVASAWVVRLADSLNAQTELWRQGVSVQVEVPEQK